jgi:hypothetical protein
MANDDSDELGRSLVQLARRHKSPRALLAAVLDKHPKARKKDVAHAAYRLMIEAADSDAAPALQDVAITLRAAE